jgi:acetolactate synthase-1/2/3 large subunit
VERTEDFAAAFDRALAYADREQRPALLEIRYDADGIAPGQTLTSIRATALARQAAALSH